MKADTAPLLRTAEQIDGEADLAELTASSAAAAETGAALGARQAEALEAASQELLCSPEIIRCVPANIKLICSDLSVLGLLSCVVRQDSPFIDSSALVLVLASMHGKLCSPFTSELPGDLCVHQSLATVAKPDIVQAD